MIRARSNPIRVVVGVVTSVLLGSVAGCTVSEWDTSGSEAAQRTSIADYNEDEAGIRASLVAALTTPAQNFNEWSPSVEEAECVATRLLSRFGPDRLLEAGYEPQVGSLAIAWTPDERTASVNILVGCIPFEDALLELILGYDKVSLDVASCISRGADRRRVPTLLARSLVMPDGSSEVAAVEPAAGASGDGDLARELAELAVDCLGPADLQPNAPVVPLPDDQRNDPDAAPGGESTTTTR